MKLVKKLRIKINREAQAYLEFASERCRLIYNFALADRIAYYKEHGKSLSVYEQKKELPALKQRFPEYAKVYNKCLSAMYFRLEKAYQYFFQKHDRFPKFKRKGQFVSQEYPGMYIKRLDNYRFIIPTGQKMPTFTARTCEAIPEQFATVTITKRKNIYYACFLVETPETQFIDNGEVLAIDLGIKTLCTGYSTRNEFVIVPKFSHYTRHLDDLRSQRDRKQKGSRLWKKWNQVFQRQLEKYLNRVNDYSHKASHYVIAVRSESTIVVGDLNLETMKTDRSWFNRICQNEWRVGRFVGMLEYKSLKYGKHLEKVDERDTTKTCSFCGRKKSLSLSERVYHCKCGFVVERDINSSINIMQKYTGTASAGVNNSKLSSIELSNLNVVKYVYM